MNFWRHIHRKIFSVPSFFIKMKLILLSVFMLILAGCQEDDIPLGFYDYQVVRLLTNDSSKTWMRTQYIENGQNQPISTCADSLYLYFLIAENTRNDSVDAFEIIPKVSCTTSDTLLLGRFAAASADNIFIDQLLYADGPIDFMQVENITSRFLKLTYERDGAGISASFEAVQQ